jgi:type II secretory pathway pseudopilin PulG
MVLERLRSQRGFGLIELLMAMTLMNVGILALVAAFQSSAFAVRQAGKVSTAATLADQQMEVFRAVPYTEIYLDATSETTARNDAIYNCDKALGGCGNSTAQITSSCSALANETGSPPPRCNPLRSLPGPDQKRYRVDTYIVSTTPISTGRAVKQVTVVVRDANDTSRVLARETTNFDLSTGL